MDSSPSPHSAFRVPGAPGLLNLFKYLFIAALVVVGWGKIDIEIASCIRLSFGGTTRGVVYILFFIYMIIRVMRKDLKGFSSLKDPLALYGLWCALSILWSRGRDFSLFFDNYLPALLCYCMLRYLLENSSGTELFLYLKILVLFAVLIVIRGPADVGGNFLHNPTVMSTTSEHHTIVAMILLMGIPLASAFLLTEEKGRWLYGGALAVMLCGLILANSRIGWFSFFFLFLFLLWAMKPGGIRVMLLTFLASFLVLFLLFFPNLHQRFMSLFNLMADYDFMARLEIWHYSFIMMREHLLGGIGFSLTAFIEEGLRLKQGFAYHHPHNGMLTVLVFTGSIGLVMSLWIISRALRALLFLSLHADSAAKPYIIAIAGSFLSLAIMNCADTLFNSPRALLVAFLLLAYLFTLREFQGRADHEG
jgi:O-antigen ligase